MKNIVEILTEVEMVADIFFSGDSFNFQRLPISFLHGNFKEAPS